MIPLRALSFCVALAACNAPAAPTSTPETPPFASEEEISAAESTPLDANAASWASPFEPFTVIGNIHYVGSGDVAAYLITTTDGHVLLDGGAPQTGPMVIAHIAALGFDIRDVKYVLNTHAHIDHAGRLPFLVHEGYRGDIHATASYRRQVAATLAERTLTAALARCGAEARRAGPGIRRRPSRRGTRV